MVSVSPAFDDTIEPAPPMVPSTPKPSETTTVNVSPLVLPLSVRLTPETFVAWFCATVA